MPQDRVPGRAAACGPSRPRPTLAVAIAITAKLRQTPTSGVNKLPDLRAREQEPWRAAGRHPRPSRQRQGFAPPFRIRTRELDPRALFSRVGHSLAPYPPFCEEDGEFSFISVSFCVISSFFFLLYRKGDSNLLPWDPPRSEASVHGARPGECRVRGG